MELLELIALEWADSSLFWSANYIGYKDCTNYAKSNRKA